MQKGDRVYIDADTKEWGRVCSGATVLEIYPNQYVQVEAYSIEATITILKKEIWRTIYGESITETTLNEQRYAERLFRQYRARTRGTRR